MKRLCFTMILLSILSCKDSEIEKQLKKSNTVTVHFFRNAESDSIIKIVRTTSRDAIEKLSGFINGKAIVPAACGRDGEILFQKDSQTLFIAAFNVLHPDCREFSFLFKGKEMATRVNNEAVDFLTALWAGKNSY